MPQSHSVDASALMSITTRPPLVFVEGQGSWLTDENGKQYLDFVQGWAVNALGHSPRELSDTLAKQAARLINPSPAYFNAPSLQLAGLLTRHSVFDQVFFCNTGAEANEGAIKLARKWGRLHRQGAYQIITFRNAFHGRTLATMSASGKPGWDTIFAPQVSGFPKAEYNNIESVATLIGPQTVAVMIEPVQGEAGVIPATPEFMQQLRALTTEQGILLIVDEVQTGMGRTGKLFGYEHTGVAPDIMTLGKGIGAGVPLAALLARREFCCFAPGDQGGTYCGNPLMTAVGVAVMERMTAPGFLAEVSALGEYLRCGLAELVRRHGLIGERGVGLLRALILDDERAPALVERARALAPQGLLLNAPRANLLRFMPALTVTREEIDLMLAHLDALLVR